MKGSFFLFITLLIASAWGQGPAPPVQIKGILSKDKINVGDVVTLTLEVRSGPGIKIDSFPKFELPGLEVKKDSVLPMRKEKGKEVRREIVGLTGFSVGSFTIPPVTVSYRNARGDSGGQVSSTPLTLTVESLLEPDSTRYKLKAEKPPLEIGNNWWPWILLGILVLLALALFLYFRKKRKQGASAPLEKIDLRPPWEIALSELEALLASSLLTEGKLKEFHIRLSEIFRIYAHRIYGIPAEDMTTQEQLELLKEFLKGENWPLAKRFLYFCDLVKFARWGPERREIMENVLRLKVLIEVGRAKPSPSPEPAAEAVGA